MPNNFMEIRILLIVIKQCLHYCLTIEEFITIKYGQTPIDGIKHTISYVYEIVT